MRAEALWSSWDAPPGIDGPLRATAYMLEGRYKVSPGVSVAARIDRLGFNRIASADTLLPWDAPVTRLEVGGAYALLRNLTAKVVYQRNRRDNTFGRSLDLAAIQLVFWF